MPDLPDGDYSRVVIHDNFLALRRYAKRRKQGTAAYQALRAFNGRYICFGIDGVSFIATGMGSAQTTCLLEALSKKGCRVVIKVGTCSALDGSLEEGQILVPRGALVDEGATHWRRVMALQKAGAFSTMRAVRKYMAAREAALADHALRSSLLNKCPEAELRQVDEVCVWSEDGYDCFNSSVELWSKVWSQGKGPAQFRVPAFATGERHTIQIAGVEMECSALFATASSLGLPAAALIVVSRTRERLADIVEEQDVGEYRAPNARLPKRDERAIQEAESHCLALAAQIARDWP